MSATPSDHRSPSREQAPWRDCTVCNVCEAPTTFQDAVESARIRSNVRRFRDEKFTVWRCSNCRSLHSLEGVDLDHYYAHYFLSQQRLDYFTRPGFSNRIRWLRSVGVQFEHRILEYGCGHGLFVDFLRQRGFRHVVGYDRYVPEYSDTSWRDETFDAVISYDVIEHVEDPRATLKEQVERLRPGGLLAVGTPNGENIGFTERDELELHQPYHRHLLSPSAMIALGREAGLEVVEVRKRLWMDTLWPFVNWTFVAHYVYQLGNVLDVVAEPPRVGAVLASPKLLFYGLAGYFFPSRAHMMYVGRKPAK
jgi:2-polyprenyl-3-methyl-5-hydroxy-6-metoxy-1,4-benzoquinol methylase